MIFSGSLLLGAVAVLASGAHAAEPPPGAAVMSAGSVGTFSSDHCVMVEHGRGAITRGAARLQGDTVVVYARTLSEEPKRCGQPYRAEAFGRASYAEGGNAVLGEHVTWNLATGAVRSRTIARASR